MVNYEHLSNYELNLMCAKYELRSQPFIKYLPQRDLFGNDIDHYCNVLNDHSVYIITESGCEQKIDFCTDPVLCQSLMLRGKINVSFYDNEDGGSCTTDTSFFIDFDYDFKRAVLITYLIKVGLLDKPEVIK